MEPGKPLWVALAWIEAHCVVPDGFKRGEPFKLYEYQGAYIRDFYTVKADAQWRPESPDLATAFIYRRGLRREEALKQILAAGDDEVARTFQSFFERSQRGIVR